MHAESDSGVVRAQASPMPYVFGQPTSETGTDYHLRLSRPLPRRSDHV